MKTKYIKFSALVLLMANTVYAQDASVSENAEKVNLAFQTLDKKQTTGSVYVVNPDEVLEYDSRQGVSAAISNKAVGLSGTNLHGIGNVIYVVDGVIRDITYLNMLEVEQVTVLKDAVSRVLYGADADTGVVLITTKKGDIAKTKLKFNVEYGLQSAISMPKFLDAATYMEVYNRAYVNDGGSVDALPFSTERIQNTRNGIDPVLYPDNDYYGDRFVKDMVNFSNVYGEASGGSDKVRYYMNLGWKRNEQWVKSSHANVQDIFTVRGKVDFQVTSWMRMNMDASVVFDVFNGPNTGTYWNNASTILPYTSTLLIPVDRVTNLDQLTGVNVQEGGYLLGGTSVYQTNLIGELNNKGNYTQMDRYAQFRTGADFDLNGITKGLTANGMFSYVFENSYKQFINNQYAIYEPGPADENGNFAVTKIGNDKFTTSQTVNDDSQDFARKVEANANLNYQRQFGKFNLAALLMGRMKYYWLNDTFQDDKRVSWGGNINSMYDNKYILEASILRQGSSKFAPGNRWGTSYAFGGGWIVSEEDFLKDNGMINYLKLRANYGEIQNDNWTLGNYAGYFLYEDVYQNSGAFNYNNGANKNNSVLISSVGNVYSWQKRKELNVGFEAKLFDNRTWIEAAYFNSINADQLTEMSSSKPATFGNNVKVVENYNSTKYDGVEFGISHTEKIQDFSITAGLNYMFTNSEILKIEEQVYDTEYNKHRSRLGTWANAMIGYKAERLYAPEDFDANGNLVEGLPQNTLGTVKPGDIKYFDYNGDNMITEDDQHVLGRNGNNHSLAININMNYKRWSLYIQATGGFGGKGFMNSNYYWFKGNQAKYSEYALLAYNPDAPDPNAKYPRLTLGNGENNYRNSTFWEYSRNQFSLATMQLSYNFNVNRLKPLAGLQAYLRGANLLMIAKDRKILQLNYNAAPQNRVFALGLVAKF